MKEYLLMHKDDIVGGSIFNARWQISDFKPLSKEHIPMCVVTGNRVSLDKLNRWFLSRNISPERAGCEALRENTGVKYIEEIIVKNGAFSLFDSFWVKEKRSVLSWKQNNFYENGYRNEISASFSQNDFSKKITDCSSPTLTIPGDKNYVWQKNKAQGDLLFCFEKKEYVLTEFFLCHMAAPLFQLPAPKIAISKKDAQYCAINIFTSPNVTYIPASYILNSGERKEEKNQYDYFMQRCKELGIPNYRIFMDTLMVFDYVFHICDRNYTDFGFLMDADTKKFLGPAPVCFHGNGLYSGVELYKNKRGMDSLVFDDIARRISLISDPNYLRIDYEKLMDLPKKIRELFIYDEKLADFKSSILEKRIISLTDKFAKIIEGKADKYKEINEQYKQNKYSGDTL